MRSAPLVLMALCLVLCLACTPDALQKQIRFSQAELQEKVDKVFPVEEKKSLLQARFSDPEILLRDGGDRIGLGLAVSVRLPGGKRLHGTLQIDSGLRYVPERGEVVLDDPQLQHLAMDGVPGGLDSILRSVAEVVARRHVTQIPIYRLHADDYQKSLTRLVLKSVSVQDGDVIATIGL
ncbi:MAG: DUF1439 domain-containing protein [Gemmatimonadetes bacterium]|nr:DUF1439 domain-containing protein [Gemmatimonadota bacterium]MBT6145593.1 DUF1439 domain-containing protein [Gemmatimonadota bacterium]MBT7863512.1 DUF1439 domain-containing protein [Gemmatimonadota bacterium]